MAGNNSPDKLEKATSAAVCCGTCLHLYEKKGGKQVWLCRIHREVRISDPGSQVCRSFVEQNGANKR